MNGRSATRSIAGEREAGDGREPLLDMTAKLTLPVRYFQDSTPADIPCREENFVRREIEMALPLENIGIRAMSRRGYNVILLRDATMGVEFPDTLDALFATELAIREAEQQRGFTACIEDFFEACNRVSRARL